jgi:hypothetical protein
LSLRVLHVKMFHFHGAQKPKVFSTRKSKISDYTKSKISSHPKALLENLFLWYMRRCMSLEDLKVLVHHPLHNGWGLRREIKVGDRR